MGLEWAKPPATSSSAVMWGFSKKPVDPLTARERELEAELKRLKSQVARSGTAVTACRSASVIPSHIATTVAPPAPRSITARSV